MMVTILQYISNQHVVCLKLTNIICQLYLNKVGVGEEMSLEKREAS